MAQAAWRPPHTCLAQALATCSQHPGTRLPCPLTSTIWPQHQPSLALGLSTALAACSSPWGQALQALRPLLGLQSRWTWMLQCGQLVRRCGSCLL
jgi:hypothetical protein